MTNYIGISAVNMSNVLSDTDQISVIRGASFLLKEAITFIDDKFEALTPITTGASEGIFRVNSGVPESLVGEIEKKLTEKDSKFKHFTFVVSHTCEDDFQKAKDQLLIKNRIKQYQQISMAPYVAKKSDKVSSSAKVRWEYGRDMKHSFYKKELQTAKKAFNIDDYLFTNDFEQIVKQQADDTPESLKNKMAVLYFDGNHFGKKQRKLLNQCESDEARLALQQDIDKNIKQYRVNYLSELLSFIATQIGDNRPLKKETSFCKEDKREKIVLPVEMLMWGGDEFLMILPAVIGFEALHHFYQASEKWKLKEKQLTHAGGLVFCNLKNPIAKMRELAQEIADKVKSTLKVDDKEKSTLKVDDKKVELFDGRSDNHYNYIVLESVDYPTQAIDDYWTKQVGETLSTWRLPLPVLKSECYSFIKVIKECLPRSQLYTIAHGAIDELVAFENLRKQLQLNYEILKEQLDINELSVDKVYFQLYTIVSEIVIKASSLDDFKIQLNQTLSLKYCLEMKNSIKAANKKMSEKDKDQLIKEIKEKKLCSKPLYKIIHRAMDQTPSFEDAKAQLNKVLTTEVNAKLRSLLDPEKTDQNVGLAEADQKLSSSQLIERILAKLFFPINADPSLLQQKQWLWLHLIELWDYLPTQATTTEESHENV